jgi:L-ribulose-5-phosphate 3-epimerase
MPIDHIGLCSWSVQPDSPESLLAALESAGITAVQLALTPCVQDPERWGDVMQHLQAAGVSVLSGMMEPVGEDYSTLDAIARTGGVRQDSTWPANEAMAEAIAAFAAEHGIGLVTLHAGFLPGGADDPERATVLDRLARAVDIHASHGVRVAFETGQETAETLLGVLAELDRPMLGVNFDPANMILYAKGDPIESFRALAPHVMQVHVKDAVPTTEPGTWGTEMPVGTGAVDWPAFFDVLANLPAPTNAVIEREGGSQRIEDIRTAHALVRRLTA